MALNGAGMAPEWRGIFAALPARISGKPDVDNIGGMNRRISKREKGLFTRFDSEMTRKSK